MKKATAALVCVATAAAVGIGLTAPAYTDAADTRITISAPQGNRPGTSDLNVNMFDGRSFTAYKLADYTNVQVSDGNVTSRDYKLDTPLTNAMVDGWIAKALDQFPMTDVATVSNGTVTFKGDAAAMKTSTLSGVTVRITVNGTVQNVTTTPTFVAAQATFSNDQGDANSTGTAEEASLGLFNTVIPVKKIAYNAGATSAALTGAQFSVTSGTTTVKFTESTLNGKPYYQVDPNGTLSTFTVGDGYIAGFGANTNNSTTYTITEKVAPTGYVLDGRHDITFNVTVTPNYTNDVLTSVTYKRDNGIYGNFLDTTPSKMTTDDGQTVNLESRTTVNNRYMNTQLESEMIHVKNTKNPSDFAQTGGHIVQVLIAMLIVAIVGAILLIVARMRRRNNTDRTQIA